MKGFMNPIFSMILFCCCFVSSVYAVESAGVAQENGVLENAQVVFLFLSGAIFVFQSFSVDRLTRLLLWMGAWLCLSFVLRELDVDKLPVPQWLMLIGSGLGRNLIVAVGWVALGGLAIKSFSELKDRLGVILKSRTAILGGLAFVFLVLGAVSEELGIQLLEESFEVLGYLFLVPSALFSKSILRD